MILRVIIVLFFMFFLLPVNASDLQNINYKNIKPSSKITYADGIWTTKINKKSQDYFVKETSNGTSNFSEFYSPDGSFLFSTGTQYEFIIDGKLIGYSNSDLKFYEYRMNGKLLQQRELQEEEVKELFPKYDIIRISDFSPLTNSLKIKKNKRKMKLILLNDTDSYFYHYNFTSNNAKLKKYLLTGFLDISKKGMIQFSHFGDNTQENPWFILLVR